MVGWKRIMMTPSKQGKSSLPKSGYNRYILYLCVFANTFMKDDFAGLSMANVQGLC